MCICMHVIIIYDYNWLLYIYISYSNSSGKTTLMSPRVQTIVAMVWLAQIGEAHVSDKYTDSCVCLRSGAPESIQHRKSNIQNSDPFIISNRWQTRVRHGFWWICMREYHSRPVSCNWVSSCSDHSSKCHLHWDFLTILLKNLSMNMRHDLLWPCSSIEQLLDLSDGVADTCARTEIKSLN